MTLAPPKPALASLPTALDFLRERVAPRAAELDRSPEALAEIMREAGEAGILGLKIPPAWGGPGLSDDDFRLFQEEAARASGSFAFLQTQHQSAGAMILRHGSEPIKRATLPLMSSGERLIGVGFSQLRREGPPITRLEPVPGGYLASGEVPWITGWGIFGEFLLGATLPTGESLFAVAPLSEGPGRTVEGPMRLAAMETAGTVAMTLDGLFLPEENVAFVKPGNWVRENDLFNIAVQSQFAFGCARGAVDVVRRAGEKPAKGFLVGIADRLDDEIERCRRETADAMSDRSEATADARLKLRAWAIDLAVRCAHAAVAASSGAANAEGHPANRLYREALVYTVSAQTLPIMRATVERLVERGNEEARLAKGCTPPA